MTAVPTKEWCEKMARLEGDSEVGAGPLAADPVFDGYILEPDFIALEHAAAIICGHDFIYERGVDDCLEFQSFVREVLTTVVKPEIERLQRHHQQRQDSTWLRGT